MSRTSETNGADATSAYRCGACENCRRDPKIAKIEFPVCQETADYHCGACENCRTKHAKIQFPNCHEVAEIRCTCGKCLAKDGKVKCSRCDEQTDVRPRLLAEARHTAFYLSALAMTAQLTRSDGKPVKITLKQTTGSMGYVQHQPASEQYMYTAADLRKQLVVLLSGIAAEEALGHQTADTANTYEQALALAHRMVGFGMVDGWDKNPDAAARSLVQSAKEEATTFVSANREAIETLAAALLYKGELTADDIACFLRQKTTD